jgi:hypothetical protein
MPGSYGRRIEKTLEFLYLLSGAAHSSARPDRVFTGAIQSIEKGVKP